MTLQIERLGTVDYGDALRRMRRIHAAVAEGAAGDTLLVLNHPPVFTSGRRFDPAQVLAGFDPEEQGGERRSSRAGAVGGIPLYRIERGGLLTYHDPGQIILYPILRIPVKTGQFRQVVCLLERTVLDFLARHDIPARTEENAPGVYTDWGKIASLGLAVHRGVSMHGLAVYINTDKQNFGMISACGVARQPIANVADFVSHDGDALAFQNELVESFRRNYEGWKSGKTTAHCNS